MDCLPDDAGGVLTGGADGDALGVMRGAQAWAGRHTGVLMVRVGAGGRCGAGGGRAGAWARVCAGRARGRLGQRAPAEAGLRMVRRIRQSRQAEEVAAAPEGARGRPPRWAWRCACRGVAAPRALARRALSLPDPRR
jgi:hypothetical protein